MFDIALSSAGAKVSICTTSDTEHRPEAMIDGKEETFFSTTGMYPQEFVLTFPSLMNVSTVSIASYNIKRLVIEKGAKAEPADFEPLMEKDMEQTEGHLQHQEFQVKSSAAAQHLRFQITAGHDHFSCIYKLGVDGQAVG